MTRKRLIMRRFSATHPRKRASGGVPTLLAKRSRWAAMQQLLSVSCQRTFSSHRERKPTFGFPLDPASAGCLQRRGCHNLQGIARLNEAATTASAAAEMKTIAARLEREYPATDRGQGILALPLAEVIVGDIRPILLLLASSAGLWLLVGCINIAALLLV